MNRILAALSADIGAAQADIATNVQMIAELDLALAMARYSHALRATPAIISEGPWPVADGDAALSPSDHPVDLIQARHPLLPENTVVPIDVYMGGNYTVLVVTGPNTGGKTVTLKTVGLMAAMSQTGMHIPAKEGSRLPVFDGVYADIGDEQSIEQSLSTFSSHMSHIVDILKHAGEESLVLLDELGAGTDPVEGAALAQTLIDELRSRRCLALCSSHYSRLKVYAFDTPGVQNASVEFDVGTLAPTYRLTIGLPGRSNAFAIARQLGLEEAIIESAAGLVSTEELEADILLANVKSASEAADAARQEAESGRDEVAAMESELRRQLASIESARRQVLEEAREQGRQELDRLRLEIRRLRPTLMAEPSATQAVHKVSEAIERLSEELPPVPQVVSAEPARDDVDLRLGDTVLVSELGQTGELTRLEGDEAEVAIGGFRLKTRPGSLEFRSRKTSPETTPAPRVKRAFRPSPGLELDLRGFRAEDVAHTLDQYLDSAYLAGLPWVHIIHGKGTGVLKQVVRQFVAGHSLVNSFRRGELTEGGDGITVVTLHKQQED